VIPASFEYFRPKVMGEAFALLEQHGEEAKILSGGQSLIPMMKLRLASQLISSISTKSQGGAMSKKRTDT